MGLGTAGLESMGQSSCSTSTPGACSTDSGWWIIDCLRSGYVRPIGMAVRRSGHGMLALFRTSAETSLMAQVVRSLVRAMAGSLGSALPVSVNRRSERSPRWSRRNCGRTEHLPSLCRWAPIRSSGKTSCTARRTIYESGDHMETSSAADRDCHVETDSYSDQGRYSRR